ncbi:MAG: hypothetical protein LBS92_01185 [Candidatus Methanoplasma sp.]|nr:hypothetical protein [Candidatus Methanoplasma sp.]
MSSVVAGDGNLSNKEINSGTYTPNTPLAEADHKHIVKLINQFADSLREEDIFPSDVIIDETIICDIVIRLQQKRQYYSVFHNIRMDSVADNKVAGIVIYWILKLRPLRSKSKFMVRPEGNEYDINDYLALNIFNKTLVEYMGDEYKLDESLEEYFEEAIYSFRYRELPKEAIILLLEYPYQRYKRTHGKK